MSIKALQPGPHCHCKLPHPAPRCGAWMVSCNRCGVRVACTAAGRADDPRSIMVPCQKAKAGPDVRIIRPENN